MAPSVDAALLGLAGLLLLAGGVLHPSVPADEAAQAEALPGDAAWVASHWVLSLGQAFAVAAVVALARRVRPPSRALERVLWAGTVLVACGFLVGLLGTLTAATVLPEAARRGPDLYAVANAGALGLGRLCMVLVGLGAVLVGSASAPRARVLGAVVAAAGLLAVASVAVFPAHHPWLHDGVLRAGALAGGALLAVAGWWVRTRP